MKNDMDIQLFRNEQFGQLRGMNIEGEPWFVGKDVAQVLGYSNSPKAIRDHVDDEDKRSERIVHPLGGVQQTTFINESGLYSLILSSKLPKAREFKRWVTAEVLPQIRRTGGYIPGKAEDDEKTILCKAVSILQRTLAELFTLEDVVRVRRMAGLSEAGTGHMISSWKYRGYISQYHKSQFQKREVTHHGNQ